MNEMNMILASVMRLQRSENLEVGLHRPYVIGSFAPKQKQGLVDPDGKVSKPTI